MKGGSRVGWDVIVATHINHIKLPLLGLIRRIFRTL